MRHLRGLSPDVNGFEGDSPGQDQPPNLQPQVHVGPPANFLSAPPVGYNSGPLHFHSTFRPEYFSLPLSLFLYQRPDATPTRNPTRPTTLPLPSSATNNQAQAAFVPPTPSVLSRHHQAPEVSISDDEFMELSARLQQGSPSVSHQFHNRDPRLRRRPY